jgi:hypothetical protein
LQKIRYAKLEKEKTLVRYGGKIENTVGPKV